MVPEVEYKSNYHIALAAYMSGAAFGGMKDREPLDLLAEWAKPASLRKVPGLQLTLKGKEARDFKLALRWGVVSQRLLDLFSA